MRALLLAASTASWMCRKRHFFTSRSRLRSRFPENVLRIRLAELGLQTTRRLPPLVRWVGTDPCEPSGKKAWRSGCADAAGAISAAASRPASAPCGTRVM